MTPELCLCSVPHSGTRFTEKLFTEHTPAWRMVGLNARPNAKPTVFEGHIVSAEALGSVLMLSGRMPVIVPLRAPWRTEQSWIRRPDRTYGADLWRAYDNLFLLYEDLGDSIVFFPIDATPLIRQIQGEKLNEACRTELDICYQRLVNSKASTWGLLFNEVEPSDRIMAIHKHPLFVQFYGDAAAVAHSQNTGEQAA